MGIVLQTELEPLLETLQKTLVGLNDRVLQQDYYASSSADAYDTMTSLQRRFNSDMAELITRFRSYYTLDGTNLDGSADNFAETSDRWEDPESSSVYAKVARATTYVDDVGKLI